MNIIEEWHGLTIDPIHKKVLELLGVEVRQWVQTEDWESNAIPDGCDDCGWRLEKHGAPVWTMDANFVLGHHPEAIWLQALSLTDLQHCLVATLLRYAPILLSSATDGRVIAECGNLTSEFVYAGEDDRTFEGAIARLFIVACESGAIDTSNVDAVVAI